MNDMHERSATKDAPRTLLGLLEVLLTRGSPRILMLLVVGFGAVRALRGQWSYVDVVVVLALAAFWPFLEWLLHTHLLHFRPRKVGRFTIDFEAAKKHRRHHRRPWDYSQVSIPLGTYSYVVPILCLVGLLGWSAPAVFTGLTAFALFSLHYEWCHFMAHSHYAPRTRFYKKVCRNHRLHHFKNETLWLGVSNWMGDVLLGTDPEQDTVPRSPNCRSLGIDASESH
jgi:hypothetical protein